MISTNSTESTTNGNVSVADAMSEELERLRCLVDRVKEREIRLAELEASCQHLRQLALERLQQIVPPPTDDFANKDLETQIRELDGQPLGDFIEELQRAAAGSK